MLEVRYVRTEEGYFGGVETLYAVRNTNGMEFERVVTIKSGGRMRCTCPGSYGHCKHIEAVLEERKREVS